MQNWTLQHTEEVTIAKNAEYNFTFFSMVNNAQTIVEPKKGDSDLNFTHVYQLLPI